MSAKSTTFAAELVENMKLEQMKHTAWRCRYSCYVTAAAGLQCVRGERDINDEVCKACPKWKASERAYDYFYGRLPQGVRDTLTLIYRDRLAKGTY